MKITIKKEDLKKPQNVAVMNLTQCKGGVHEKTNKAKRRKEKMNLKKATESCLYFCN